ncbi:MAG: DNA/RNA nuclease SfsA [Deltaproteobacteria bacterium]|nr:DNA/RNA nuclease SfsA [Deltaproteobacteria bacterium]
MRFSPPLLTGRLLRRYKRFFAEVELEDGQVVTAHTPNTGSMKGCSDPGSPVRLSISQNPARKLPFTLEMVGAGGGWVGVNTSLANTLAQEAIETGGIPPLAGYGSLRREVPYGHRSRVDFLLESPDRKPCFVEVKNVTLARDGTALFPDAPTERGQKHLQELAAQVLAGDRAVMLFVVQREDADRFSPADDIDPRYGELLRKVQDDGVELLAWGARVSPEEIILHRPLKIQL